MKLLRSTMKRAAYIALTILILVALYTAALTVAFRINNGRVLKNGSQAVEIMDEDYPVVFFEKEPQDIGHGSQLDRFSDRIIFGTAAGGWSKDRAETWSNYLNMAMSMDGYSRYWHGYVAILRPMLVFLSFYDIQRIAYLVFMLLSAGVLLSIGRRLGSAYAMVFALSYVLIASYCIPMSFQYFSVFLIMLLAALLLLNGSRFFVHDDAQMILFVVIGSLTSFLDLLTAPLVTLGFPLSILLLMMHRHGRADRSECYPVVRTVVCSASWGMGYAGTWACKWLLGGWILGSDVLGDALDSIVSRTTGHAEVAAHFSVERSLELNLETILIWKPILIILACVLICLCAVGLYKRRDKRRALMLATSLGVVAVMPYVWYIVVTNHSQVHYWFTYRAQLVSVVAGMWALLSCFLEEERLSN